MMSITLILTVWGYADMPELPEVEVTKQDLYSMILESEVGTESKTIAKVLPYTKEFFTAKTNPRNNKKDFLAQILKYDDRRKELENSKITSIYRIAKYIIISTDASLHFVIHLGMSATVYSIIATPNDRKLIESGGGLEFLDFLNSSTDRVFARHHHTGFLLKDGRIFLFHDVRRFGEWAVLTDDELNKFKDGFGSSWDPHLSNFDSKSLIEFINNHPQKTTRKWNQSNMGLLSFIGKSGAIKGCGAIYSREVVFASGLDPSTPISSLKEYDWINLANSMQTVLSESISDGGTAFNSKDADDADSVRSRGDFVRPSGQLSRYQEKLKSYKKKH